MVNKDYVSAKRKALEKYFGRLNDMQKKAVFNVNGPLLILAGAGSGKTLLLHIGGKGAALRWQNM